MKKFTCNTRPEDTLRIFNDSATQPTIGVSIFIPRKPYQNNSTQAEVSLTQEQAKEAGLELLRLSGAHPVDLAIETLAHALKTDNELYFAWHANLVTAVKQAAGLGGIDSYTANRAATNFLKTITDAEPAS